MAAAIEAHRNSVECRASGSDRTGVNAEVNRGGIAGLDTAHDYGDSGHHRTPQNLLGTEFNTVYIRADWLVSVRRIYICLWRSPRDVRGITDTIDGGFGFGIGLRDTFRIW